jgi:hypothetical protein
MDFEKMPDCQCRPRSNFAVCQTSGSRVGFLSGRAKPAADLNYWLVLPILWLIGQLFSEE